jgi:hypothetical protein
MKRFLAATSLVAVLVAASDRARGVTVQYLAPTGQTAEATFSFANATTLRIVLTETSSASVIASIGDSSAKLLTSIGFLLPGSVQLKAAGSTVTLNAGSSTVGFSVTNSSTPGFDVSREWGVTQGKKPIGTNPGSNWDFVSSVTAQVTQLAGTNRDGPTNLDGPQGGLLNQTGALGGLGFINHSVVILAKLTSSLTATQQASFLDNLRRPGGSIVEWGSDATFGVPVAEPGTGAMILGFVVPFGAYSWRRPRREPSRTAAS